LIPRLLVVFTWQPEILVTNLGDAMTSQKVELVKGVGWHVQKEKMKNVHLLKISQLQSNFQGVIITPLEGFYFWGELF